MYDFAEISKNLAGYIDLKIMNYQINYVGRSNWLLESQNFLQYYSSCLSFLHNYFDSLTKLFSDLYLAKFFDILVQSFFSCINKKISSFVSIHNNKD